MDEFPWKYVVFYVFYHDDTEYVGNATICWRTRINSADEFRKMEVYVRDIQKDDDLYEVGLVVTGFALLAKPSLWTRAKLLWKVEVQQRIFSPYLAKLRKTP